MQINIEYSELLIERGTRDPLGVWRVGDRIAGELLPPFNTVVSQRPARYFSMYSWIIKETAKQCVDASEKLFWQLFFELEAIFLIAMQFHTPHNYSDISGNIGSEDCGAIINSPKNKDTIDFTKRKIKNGWEANYNNSMREFGLFDNDYGINWKFKLTTKGENLAKLYEESIADSQFITQHRKERILSIDILKDLSNYSCPCLIHKPQNDLLLRERDNTTNILLLNSEKANTLLYDSIQLILDYLRIASGATLSSWRTTLSTGFLDTKKQFTPSSELFFIYQLWKLYNLDSLFVYSLESGLHNFLEVLASTGNRIVRKKLSNHFSKSNFDTVMDNVKNKFNINRNDILESMGQLESTDQYELEKYIIDQINDSVNTPAISIYYSYLLYCYSQAIYNKIDIDDKHKTAIKFYSDRAWYDGAEKSLLSFSQTQTSINVDYTYFFNCFLVDLIINRSLSIRKSRNKQVAWFCETETEYEWENSYNPRCYRASRFENVLGCLHNLNIIKKKDGKWFIDVDSPLGVIS